MKTSKSQFLTVVLTLAVGLLCFNCKNNNANLAIASQKYQDLSETYLKHLANFNWEASFDMLSDDVVFKLPDGDSDTRTTFTGLEDVKAFWNTYQQRSGNQKAIFTDFVHLPVQVKQAQPNICSVGNFNLSYFSAELHYGSTVAKVRMHWAIHFNEVNKIDHILTYYDRTPIIEAAKQNMLSKNNGVVMPKSDMVVQVVKLMSSMDEEELLKIATERAEAYKGVPGLLQKYYVQLEEPGAYGGVLIWDSKASLQAFSKTELAKTIPTAYKVLSKPEVDVSEILFQLRD